MICPHCGKETDLAGEVPATKAKAWASFPWGTVEALAHMYNTRTPDYLPAVETLSDKRRLHARRWLKAQPAEGWWEDVFAEYWQSPFLNGKSKPNAEHANWRPDFDWLLANGRTGVENCIRVHDGAYRGRSS